jgi:hypothetical protein
MFDDKLCFVKQPHSEIGIRANSKDIMDYYEGLYPERNATHDSNELAPLGAWKHESWSPENGHCRLRLDCLNSFDGLTFVNFNINPGNDSDAYPLGDDFVPMTTATLKNPIVAEKVNSLVDSPAEKSFSKCIIQLLETGKAQLVQTHKWVFCRKPKLPSELLRKGLNDMTGFRRNLWHHYSKKEDSMREGMSKNGKTWQVPCADFGGISKLEIPLIDVGYGNMFDSITPVPYTDGMVKCYESPYPGIKIETIKWAKSTINKYMSSRGQPNISIERFGYLITTLEDLFDRERGQIRSSKK